MQAATDVSSPGYKIRSAREAAGLTREEFARQARVSTSMVARLELRDQLPNSYSLGRIAALAGIPVTDLLPPADLRAAEPVGT